MKTWLSIRAYAKLIDRDFSKEENGEIFIEADSQERLPGAPVKGGEILKVDMERGEGIQFVEKTIGTILNMHEKVMDAKDETLQTLKNENSFLKDALLSELNATREELEFMKRKYRLMWGKVVEKHAGEES